MAKCVSPSPVLSVKLCYAVCNVDPLDNYDDCHNLDNYDDSEIEQNFECYDTPFELNDAPIPDLCQNHEHGTDPNNYKYEPVPRHTTSRTGPRFRARVAAWCSWVS